MNVQPPNDAMVYIRKLEGLVRQLRADVRIFRTGSFVLGLVAGGVAGVLLAHLLHL